MGFPEDLYFKPRSMYTKSLIDAIPHGDLEDIRKSMLQKRLAVVLSEIKETSADAIGAITAIFQEGLDQGVFVERHPVALADIIWATYSGVVLWVDSKRLLNNEKDFVIQTLETAFELIAIGLTRSK